MNNNVINYKDLTSKEKVSLLEDTVLHGTFDELKELIQTIPLSEFEFTARALGFACGYGSKEKVQLLLDYGIRFSYEDSKEQQKKYQYLCEKYAKTSEYMLFLAYTGLKIYTSFFDDDLSAYHFGSLKQFSLPPLLSNEERAEITLMILERGCEGFDAQALLYYAILWKNHEVTEVLKAAGVKIFSSEDSQKQGAHFSYYETLTNTTLYVKRYEFCEILHSYSPKTVVEILSELDNQLKNLGDSYTPIIFKSTIFEKENTPFISDFVLTYFVENTNISKMTKKSLMQLAVDNDAIGTLETIVRLGWLSKPFVRDNLINYASEKQKIQSLAWLINYKNSTANLLEEQEKREKREWAQLNASPNSVLALKQLWSFKVLENNTIAITKYKGDDEHVIVPSKIGKRAVTVIGKKAFSCNPYDKRDEKYIGIKNVKTVVIPEGVEKIEYAAFAYCHSLTSILIPETVQSIEYFAFAECWNLENITLPSQITVINRDVFFNCNSLKNIVLPQKLKIIESGAFSECSSLENITIPENVSHIKISAFYSCTNLTSLTILSKKIEITQYSFSHCTNLKDIFVVHKDCTAIWLVYFRKITIHAPKNTFAMRYARKNNIAFVQMKSN